jgi:hypothetical protein
VPQGWTEAAPAIRMLAQVFPTNSAAALAGEEGVFSQMALSSLAGRAVAAAATRSVGGTTAAAGSTGRRCRRGRPCGGHHHRHSMHRGVTAMTATHSSRAPFAQAPATDKG